MNFFIVYESYTCSRDINTDFTLKICLFGSVKLTKNAYPDKYKYSGYFIGLDSRSFYLLPDNTTRRNVIIFGADMDSSVHIDNKGKDIFIIGDVPTQGLDDTTLAVETIYSINFTKLLRKFCLSLHYNGRNSLLFVNATKIYRFKAKDFKIKKNIPCV